MRFLDSLSFKLLGGLLSVVLVAFAIYSWLTVRAYERALLDQLGLAATRTSDVIKASTHDAMLANRKGDVYRMIDLAGSEPGMEGIRIYNKRGEITYSTEESERGRMVDLHAEACVACHEQDRPLEAVPVPNRIRIYRGPAGHRILGMINPVRNEPACAGGGCHESVARKTVLGIIDVRLNLTATDDALTGMHQRTLWHVLVTMAAIVVASTVFIRRTVRRPIDRLMDGTRQVGSGLLEHKIPVESEDELGRLARSFNEMAESLSRSRLENETWARTLEERVRLKTEELERIYGRITQIEKMASLGKLAASVAHEINNPLAGILAYARLVSRRIQAGPLTAEKVEETVSDLELIARETARCGEIVRNLLLFSRKQSGNVQVVPIRDAVDKATRLIAHHMEMAGVTPDVSIEPDSISLIGDEDQLQQALVAIMVNAVEAMPEGGRLTVRGRQPAPDGPITIAISDTGTGIDPDDLPHVFEPFFSTKKEGKGTGLGLSIAYAITERHGGGIQVDSRPGHGTTFTLTLPSTGQRKTT